MKQNVYYFHTTEKSALPKKYFLLGGLVKMFLQLEITKNNEIRLGRLESSKLP